MTSFNSLPPETTLNILKYLNHKELSKFKEVSKQNRDLAQVSIKDLLKTKPKAEIYEMYTNSVSFESVIDVMTEQILKELKK